jgi:hypothetical protein
MATTGIILELGSGWYSTPILHEIAAAQGRRLITVDNDPAWLSQFSALQDHNHTLIRVDNWDQFDPNGKYGLVFVDHAPGERRPIEMARLAPMTDLFVVHDTEAAGYNFERTLSLYQHVETDKTIPWTSIYRGHFGSC